MNIRPSTIHVTPPEGALAGSTAALPIFVSDGDGRGQSTLSLRFASGVSHGMELAHHGDWLSMHPEDLLRHG